MKKMKKRALALLLVLAMVVSCFAACSGETNSSSTNSTSGADSETDTTQTAAGPDDTTEHEEFTVYYNYPAWNYVWGEDEYSQYLSEKFNVDLTWFAGENDPDAKLNLMISSGDIPDAIITERGAIHNKLVDAGVLVDLETLMYDGCSFAEDIPENVREMLKVDGKLYAIPSWARSNATGGNVQWMLSSQIYEKVGAENVDLTTLEGLHDYAMAVKEGNYTSYNGASVYPFLCANSPDGYQIYWPMFRALGGRELLLNYWTQEDGVIQFGPDNEKFVEALRIANTWFNDGLISQEIFTDSAEQTIEKLTNGRGALIWYDYAAADQNGYRNTMRQQSGGEEEWLILGYDIGEKDKQFPGAEGTAVTYGDGKPGVGWNINCITTSCSNPQRLFDLFTYMLTPEATLMMMYGPVGGSMLEGIDDSGDLPLPILKKDISEFTQEEKDAAGSWRWTQPAQSDYTDGIKFAMNDQLPEDKQDWVITRQTHLSTYDPENPVVGQMFVTDQLTGIDSVIDPQDDLGICLTSIQERCEEMLPKIIMAASEDEFNSLLKELSAFAKSNRIEEINEAFQAKFDANVEAQGFDAYSEEYDVYHLNK